MALARQMPRKNGERWGLVALIGAAALVGRPAHAQAAVSGGPAARADTCAGQVVSSIVVNPEPPSLIAKSLPHLLRPVAQVLLQHKTTRPSAILPFLLLREGATCTEFKRTESERLVRAQPYIADAAVHAVPDTGGTVRIEVSTTDEIPLVAAVQFGRGTLSAITYGNSNILGAGMFGAIDWENGFAYRDGFGARYTDYHAFGQRYVFSGVAERYPRGNTEAASLSKPFLTDAQRTAWYVGGVDMNSYVSFMRPDAPSLSLSVEHTRADVGGVFRIGGRSTGLFAGPLVSYESIQPATHPVVISRAGYVADTSTALVGRYPAQRTLWAGGVVGTRLLSFVEARGFDAVVGPQDIARGVQLSGLLARGIGTGEHSTLGGVNLYAGVGTPRSFLAAEVLGEGRTGVASVPGWWNDAVASGRLAWYDKPTSNGLYLASAEFSGAWRERIPYELALGAFPSGVRGYSGSNVGGAQRAVLRLERRWVLGHLTRFDRVGVAAFTDAGATWGGRLPFAVSSGYKQGLGVGILAAVPPQSRQVIRLDAAVPLIHAPGARYDIRLTVSMPARSFWRDPGDLAPTRTATSSSGNFAWP
jgi:hypothetical protein